MHEAAPVTVVEMPEFIRTCGQLMGDAERMALIDFLSSNPTAGVVVPETGGVRKLRWGLAGRGKRGGARVIYFHLRLSSPLFALAAYAKNEKEDLTASDKKIFRKLTAVLVEQYGRTDGEPRSR
jgi:hypothetical protein